MRLTKHLNFTQGKIFTSVHNLDNDIASIQSSPAVEIQQLTSSHCATIVTTELVVANIWSHSSWITVGYTNTEVTKAVP